MHHAAVLAISNGPCVVSRAGDQDVGWAASAMRLANRL
jgi:hypothetical protein